MSSSVFSLKEHTFPCTHIRAYPRATAGAQEDVLHLAIKQYTPLDNSSPQPGDVTIIGAHANGFPKELYEPLWDELHRDLQAAGIRIRGIWIADVAHQGASSVLNESQLGNDPSWHDHPRDLFLMINHFRDQMPRPLIGIGHSMGGANLISLSLIHPRLFSTLVLVDPVVHHSIDPRGNFAPARASAVRRDRWPSRAAARTAFAKSKFYQGWDPRVLDRWIKHGLRDLPTALYPAATPASATLPVVSADASGAMPQLDRETEVEVTLTTTKHQEVLTFLRPVVDGVTGAPATLDSHPDVDLAVFGSGPFYRSESLFLFSQLPYLRPSVLYVFGTESNLSSPQACADKMAVTGSGVGGSGGAAKGRVKQFLMQGGSHLMPMERVCEVSEEAAQWIVPELRRFQAVEEEQRKIWDAVPKEKKSVISDVALELLQGDALGKLLGSAPAKRDKAKL